MPSRETDWEAIRVGTRVLMRGSYFPSRAPYYVWDDSTGEQVGYWLSYERAVLWVMGETDLDTNDVLSLLDDAEEWAWCEDKYIRWYPVHARASGTIIAAAGR